MKKRDNTDDLGSALRRLFRSGKLRNRYYQSLIQHFFDTEFSHFRKDIRQIRLINQKLIIHVESAALRNELQLSRDLLKKRLNEVLQESYLNEVEIR